METIIAALISAGAAIIVCVINSRSQAAEFAHKLELSQAVTNTKLDELTREVREHNNFAKRMPVLEEKIRALEKGDDGK